MKCVMIIDPDLPRGLQLNAAASLGVSLASRVPGLAGGAAADADGNRYEGITRVPIPVLALGRSELALKLEEARAESLRAGDAGGLLVFAFTDVAQASLRYEDYEAALGSKGAADVAVLGLCLYGPKKVVNGLTGSLPMAR